MSVNQAAVSSLLLHHGASLLRSMNRKAQTNAGEIKEVYHTNTPPLSEHLSAASLFNLQAYPGVSGPAGDFYGCRRRPQSFYTYAADLIHFSEEVDVKMSAEGCVACKVHACCWTCYILRMWGFFCLGLGWGVVVMGRVRGRS